MDYGESKDSDLRIPIGNFVRDCKNFAMVNKVKIVLLSQLKAGSVHDQPDESSYSETSKIGEEIDGSFFVYKPLVACDPMPDGTLRPIITPAGGRLFALEDHLTRLGRSAANLRLPIDLDAVRADIETLVRQHKYTLFLTGHSHEYKREPGDPRAIVMGLGGAPFDNPNQQYWGYGTIMQCPDDHIYVTVYDQATGNIKDTFNVPPQ